MHQSSLLLFSLYFFLRFVFKETFQSQVCFWRLHTSPVFDFFFSPTLRIFSYIHLPSHPLVPSPSTSQYCASVPITCNKITFQPLLKSSSRHPKWCFSVTNTVWLWTVRCHVQTWTKNLWVLQICGPAHQPQPSFYLLIRLGPHTINKKFQSLKSGTYRDIAKSSFSSPCQVKQ